MRPLRIFRSLEHFFPVLGLLVLSCAPDSFDSLPLSPPADNGGGQVIVKPGGPAVELDIKLEVKEGKARGFPDGTMLAVVRDGDTSDSTSLYIDVEITNAGGDMVFMTSEVENLVLAARVTFVDIPFKKNFSYGKLKLVIGWTDGGLQASEVQEWEFDTDSTLTFSMPLTRADSFKVADNVAVYGVELADDLFIHATRVQRLGGNAPDPEDPPELVGFIKRIDRDADRLYVSGATVVIADSTLILDTDSVQITLDDLRNGSNELTITGLAWGFSDFIGMTANGWEFRRFTVYVAEPVSP
ncbi:MAG: hypothetical protein FVQ81_02385 [Candidatus Glassbacteria bacterium]|nr:hypothetical protein [Candidatus Glassbacteria bacterium]